MKRREFITLLGGAAVALPAMAQEKIAQPSTLESGQVPVAETLARYAINLKYEDLPQEVVRTAKRTILDTVGCGIGGYSAGPSQIAIKLASGVSATQAATILCSGIKTSHELAVFANGVMIRYLDFNDGYITPKGGGHPSDTIAALLSSAEIAGSSGRDLILATALSYEVFCKVADVLDTRGLGLDQATMLGLASVVGAGRLMGLTHKQMVHAIGITVGGNTAINQGRVGTLSNWKDFACADASRKAIFSAQLAQAGMTGPNQVFEGPLGFFKVISRKPFELPKLGEPFGIMRAFTKRFPLGQYSQTVAEAAAGVRSLTLMRSRKSTFVSPRTRSKSWLVVPTNGARNLMKPPTIACLMRRRSYYVQPRSANTFSVPIRHGSKVLATIGVSYFISAMPKTKAIASYVPPLLDLAKKIEASVADLTRVQ